MKRLFTLLLSVLLVGPTFCAPAPLRRAERPSGGAPPQKCVLVWWGAEYDATFAPDGYYHADREELGQSYPDAWMGKWSRRGSIVTVEERRPGPFWSDVPCSVYTFDLADRSLPIHVRPYRP